MYPTGSHLRLGLLALLVLAVALSAGCSRDVQTEPREADPVTGPETGHVSDATQPGAIPSPQQGQEDDVAKRYKVQREQRKLHCAQLVQEGREFFLRGEYHKALKVLSEARYLDKENQEATALLSRVTAALDQRMGRHPGPGRTRKRPPGRGARAGQDSRGPPDPAGRQSHGGRRFSPLPSRVTKMRSTSFCMALLVWISAWTRPGSRTVIRDARERLKTHQRDLEQKASEEVLRRKREERIPRHGPKEGTDRTA